MNPSYEDVSPYLIGAEQVGSDMKCTFRCEWTDTTVEATTNIEKANRDSVSGRAMAQAQKALEKSLLRTVVSAVRGLLGKGVVGKIAGDAAKQATAAKTGQRVFTEEHKQAAILAAFQKHFVFDQEREAWVNKTAKRRSA